MMSRRSKTSKPLILPLLIVGVVILWGSSFVLSKFALEEIGAVTLAFYRLTSRQLIGDLFTLLSALCWAIYSVWGKRTLARHKPLLVTSVAASFGTIFLLTMAL